MAIMIILFGGESIRGYLSFIPQNIYNLIIEKKFIIALINFFVINSLSTSFGRTGAFEVIINHDRMWSKLNTGVLPTYNDIAELIQKLA